RRRRAATAERLPGDEAARGQDSTARRQAAPDRGRAAVDRAVRGDRQQGRGGPVADRAGEGQDSVTPRPRNRSPVFRLLPSPPPVLLSVALERNPLRFFLPPTHCAPARTAFRSAQLFFVRRETNRGFRRIA